MVCWRVGPYPDKYYPMTYWICLLLVGLLNPYTLQAQGQHHQGPTVTITTPTSGTTYTTATTPLLVGGTTRDTHAVTSVTWTNDRGGSGTAKGTTTWSASIP